MLLLTMQINCATGPTVLAPPWPFLFDEKQPPSTRDGPGSADERLLPTSTDAPKVLLVDDSERTLARAKSLLSASCVVVATATNGEAALAAAAACDPDVVVLDISMQGMNGFELAVRLHAAGSTAKFVFLTIHDEEELILAARKAGGLGYVVKTRIASDLELAVREARNGRSFQSPRR